MQGPPSPVSRNLGLAQDAFTLKDTALSRAAHSPVLQGRTMECEAGHTGMMSPMHTCVVFGALDGLVSCVVAVAAISTASDVGLQYSISVVTSIIFGLALGPGLRNHVKYCTEFETFARERRRELWEMQNFVEGERNEMVELFVSDGVAEADARKAIDLLSQPQYEDFFVDLMMVKELNMQIPDKSYPPAILGLATAGVAFGTGMLPVLGYLLCWVLGLVNVQTRVLVVVGVPLLALGSLSRLNIPILHHRSMAWVYGCTLAICACAAVGTTMALGIPDSTLLWASYMQQQEALQQHPNE